MLIVDELRERIEVLEALVKSLLHVSMETEDFWPYVSEEEKQQAIDFVEKH